MDITYTLLPNGMVQRSDGAFIPNDPGNRDYQEFLAWKAEGNEPAREREPEPVQEAGRLPDLDDLLRRIEALERQLAAGNR